MKIIGVAVKKGDIMICLPEPNRHSDCIFYGINILRLKPPMLSGFFDQGFYTEDGNFLDRVKALTLAKKNGLKTDKEEGQYLFSEDLW